MLMGTCSYGQERAHTQAHIPHKHTLSKCSGKLPGSHARLYGFGSCGEREWAICGVLLTGPKESRGKLRRGWKETSGASLGSKPETSTLFWSAVDSKQWASAQEPLLTTDHTGER